MSTPPRIAIEALRHRNGPHFQLDVAQLDLGPGVHLLRGANGAGKTTLLRVLATLVRPEAGAARVCGHALVRDARAVRAVTGYAGHAPSLHAPLTVAANLHLHAKLHRLDDAAVARALDTWALVGLAGRRVDQLSQGEARRVDLARATLHQPRVLLLDEPFQGLDAIGRERLRNALEGDTQQLVLVATHGEDVAAPSTTLTLTEGRLAEVHA